MTTPEFSFALLHIIVWILEQCLEGKWMYHDRGQDEKGLGLDTLCPIPVSTSQKLLLHLKKKKKKEKNK